VNFLDAWVKTGMVPPYVMATASWGQQQCVPNETPELTCNDGKDNDCDGLTDCDDTDDCGTNPSCGDCTLIEFPLCFDGADNDCDGLTDCADRTDCDDITETTICGLGVCKAAGSLTCRNGALEEIICTPGDPTEPDLELTCNDGLDNDCDGLTDAADPDCMACSDYSDKGSCNNDPACEWSGNPKNGSCRDAQVCTPTSADEIGLCGDGVDNDCDGQTDCADTADCGTDPACQTNCSDYADRGACNNDPACSWSGSPRKGSCGTI